MEVYNVSTQIMDLFSSSYTYQRQKTQERKLGTRILLLFLHFKFKAWYVFQTYIENNWTAWSHSWPSWSWSETFWKCQLIKEWKKKNTYMLELFLIALFRTDICNWLSEERMERKRSLCICMVDGSKYVEISSV